MAPKAKLFEVGVDMLIRAIKLSLESMDKKFTDLSRLKFDDLTEDFKESLIEQKIQERPFAYEFYHQFRKLWDSGSIINIVPVDVVIQAEVNKSYQGIPELGKIPELWDIDISGINRALALSPVITKINSTQTDSLTKVNSIEAEREKKIEALFTPKGEFETTKEYEARDASAKAEEVRIRKEYDARIKEERWRKERRLKEEMEKLYPHTLPLSLSRYNADAGGFEAEVEGNKVFIPVQRGKAIEISKHKDKLDIQGMVRYYDSENVELVNAYLVDKASNEKFAFGKHVKSDWETGGFDPADTKAWKEAGFNSQEAAACRKESVDPTSCKNMLKQYESAGFDFIEAREWFGNGFDINGAKEWKDRRFSPVDALARKKNGLGVEVAAQWSKAEINPAAVAEWSKAGFSANAAAEWKNGFEPAEAKEWRAVFKDADEALEWKNAGLDPATARSLKKRGIGPDEAKELESQINSTASELCGHYESLSQTNKAINRQNEVDLTSGTTNLYERRQLAAAKLYLEQEIGRLRNEYKKSVTSGKAGGLTFAGPSKGPIRKR